ncbi:hypothetical protein [Pinisolibacter sp.]|uniref:hypothetical protein n=1 Tax=Pinisolibacter sp. TaxID=2172024 RepID=UPI002FDD74A5
MPDLMPYWPVIGLLTPLVLGAAGWAIRMGLASKKDLDDHAKAEEKARQSAIETLAGDIGRRLDEIEASQEKAAQRTIVIETEIRHLPSSEDIAGIKQELAGWKAGVAGLEREMQSISRSVTRIESSLMKGVGRE